jgi:hypothetical protein
VVEKNKFLTGMTEFPVSFFTERRKRNFTTDRQLKGGGNGLPYLHPLIPDCIHALVFLLYTHRKDIIE